MSLIFDESDLSVILMGTLDPFFTLELLSSIFLHNFVG